MTEAMQTLHVPGPSPLPERVRDAVAGQMINPRGPEFAELLAECTEGLRSWLLTRHDVLFFAASGTGALEATVANLLSPREPALFCTIGWFGEVWADIAQCYGAQVSRLRSPWGSATDPAALADALDRHPSVRTVFLTHNETSTGVRNDLLALATVVKQRGRLLAVDSVSGAPGHALALDEVDADVVVLASQKGWLAPPGLSMVVVSPAALAATAEATCPRFYFDFRRQKAQHDAGRAHTTPALPAMYGLREGLRILRLEGREAVWRRQREVGDVARAGVAGLGLTSVAAGGRASDTVTAVHSPYASPAQLAAMLARLRTRYGIVLAEGLGPLHGHSFRIGHLGAVTRADIAGVLERLDRALADAAIAA